MHLTVKDYLQDSNTTTKSCPLEYPFDTIVHAVHSGTSHNLSQGEFMPVLTKLLHLSTKICSCVSGPNTQVDQCMIKYGSKIAKIFQIYTATDKSL